MRAYLKYIKLTCIITACAVLLIVYMITTLVKRINTPPFELNRDYISFELNTREKHYFTNSQKVNNELKSILSPIENIIIVKVSADYSRLYLYDPSLSFFNSNFDGTYFSEKEFKAWQSNSIMVDKKSAYFYMMEDQKLYFDGEYKNVIATYSSNSPMKIVQNGCYTIETLAGDTNITGRYYISNYNPQMIEKITNVFQNDGYELKFLHKQGEDLTNIKQLLAVEMITMLPCLVIILFANFITIRLLFTRVRRTLAIHFYYGATLGMLLQLILKETIGSIFIGVTAGTLITAGILYGIYREWNYLSIIINPFISTLLMLFTITFSYMTERKKQMLKGW